MKKADAIRLFGSRVKLARGLGLSRARVSQLPDDLPLAVADRVIGAAIRLGLPVPDQDQLGNTPSSGESRAVT